MKQILILSALFLLSLSLGAQDDNQIIERETTMTKEVEVQEEDGILTVKILTKDDKGNEEVTVWTGTADDEDMPEDVRVIVEDGLKKENSQKQIRLKVLDDDGNEKLLEWDGTGEMPAEMKELLEENGHSLDSNIDSRKDDLKAKHTEKRAARKFQYDPSEVPQYEGRGYPHKYGSKAKIGVKIQTENGKVVVVEPMPNSAGEKAGVEAGDILTQLDDTLIDSLDRLYAELATHNPGDKVELVITRKGKKKTLKIILD